MATEVLQVKGMTCGHCKQSVESALQALDGVVKATVDLTKGEVQVETSAPVSREAFSAAIDDAGYELV